MTAMMSQTTTSIRPPYFASTMQQRVPVELEALYHRTRRTVSDEDKRIGLELLIEANCSMIDTGLLALVEQLSKTHPSLSLDDTQLLVEDVKAKARYYIQWVGGFVANDRLPPVIAHYYKLMHQLDLGGGSKPYLAFNIEPAFAADLRRVLRTLEAGSTDDLDEVVELLVRVFEETMKPLLINPKDLMKFNFFVDKTLNGVIGVVMSLYKRMLRRTIPKLPREVYPQVASHLGTFLVS
jgi:hypothetical protein